MSLEGVQESGFNIMTSEKLEQEKGTVIVILDESWDKFWDCTIEEFRLGNKENRIFKKRYCYSKIKLFSNY